MPEAHGECQVSGTVSKNAEKMPEVRSAPKSHGGHGKIVASENAFENYDLKGVAPGARDPLVQFAFDFPELLAAFRIADRKANMARKSSRRIGMLAVLFVLAALVIASAYPVLGELDHEAHVILGYVSTVIGLAGAVLGFLGMHKGSARRKWLRARLQTEIMRLFHFHYMAARLPELASVNGDAERQQAYLRRRAEAFAALQKGPLAKPELELKRIEAREQAFGPDDVVPEMASTGQESQNAVNAVFEAWRSLRFDWQLGYCEAKLADKGIKGRLSSKQTETLFAVFAWSCIGVVVTLHLLQLGVDALHLEKQWLEVAVVWTALAALASRALEDGLQPQREVERYEQYRANILVARERLEAAASFAARLEVIRAFERTSLEEMRVFMRTHARARFLL